MNKRQHRLLHDKLARIVQEGVGSASMCWENPAGAGVFDSNQALVVADRIIDGIRQHYFVSPKKLGWRAVRHQMKLDRVRAGRPA